MSATQNSTTPGRAIMMALAANFVWINLSESARYLMIVRPMLHELFPDRPDIGAFDLKIFAIWGVWDLVLILAATGFYWLWLERFRVGLPQVLAGSLAFSLTVFGLLWLGIANMGLASIDLLWVALPLAWIEQAIACAITAWAFERAHSSASIRSM